MIDQTTKTSIAIHIVNTDLERYSREFIIKECENFFDGTYHQPADQWAVNEFRFIAISKFGSQPNKKNPISCMYTGIGYKNISFEKVLSEAWRTELIRLEEIQEFDKSRL